MLVTLICEQCHQTYERDKSNAKGSRFCSRECKYAFHKTAKWVTLICPECGNEFTIRELYANRVDIPCCSTICARSYAGKTGRNGAGQWAKDKEKRLRATEKMRGKLKRGVNHPQFKQLPDDQIKSDYENGMSCWELAKKYETSGKTILKHLRMSGVTIERYGFGKALICEDGHKVQSSPELQIDNWLSRRHIEHTVHPRLPFGGYADFLVKGVYIEFWGIENSTRYETRKVFKLSQYQALGLPLISIMPPDIENGQLDKILNPLIG